MVTPCTPCHTVALNPPGGGVRLGVPEKPEYKPGEAQTWILEILEIDTTRRFGFQLTVTAGTLSSSGGVLSGTLDGKPYLSQSVSASRYTIQWTPPSDARGEIKVYVAGLSARGTRDGKVFTASYTLAEAAPPPPAGPALREDKPAVSLATGEGVVAAGTLMAIHGERLTPDGERREWSEEEDLEAPGTELAGVRVMVNGVEAPVVSVSPERILALVPEDEARGRVEVRVVAPHGEGRAEVERVDSAPALYARGALALADHADGALLADGDEFSLPWLGRPARAGSVLALAASGMDGIDDLARIEVRVGEAMAEVLSLERGAPGLWRLKVKLPADLEPGEHELKCLLDGNPLPGAGKIPIRK